MSCNHSPGAAEIELQRCFENLMFVYPCITA